MTHTITIHCACGREITREIVVTDTRDRPVEVIEVDGCDLCEGRECCRKQKDLSTE